eukprot:TRINITY_DN3972_c0_g1_i1.p1 TRINITY_DN3972_c0_g1~~TRINITY_DN3972_c0_g1_i1.p1  ORF type:complete len:329 (-),score=85.09 TRINITY_DN3972_c0_g1_i1:31-1017(-)
MKYMKLPLYFDNHFISLESVDEGKKILGNNEDVFVLNTDKIERSMRLLTNDEISIQEFTKFQSEQVIPWEEEDKIQLSSIIKKIKVKLERLNLRSLPETVYLVLTTGKEEGGAAYCRGKNGIFFPRNLVEWKEENVDKISDLFLHELFHIISRNLSPLSKNQVYSIIGYEPIGKKMEFPSELIKMTNPDAIFCEHYIRVEFTKNEEHCLVPVMCGKSENCTSGFFRNLQLVFIQIEKNIEEDWVYSRKKKALEDVFMVDEEEDDEEELVIYSPNLPPSFWDKVGKNTTYIHHPEEILADNFSFLTGFQIKKISSEDIINKLKIFFEYK